MNVYPFVNGLSSFLFRPLLTLTHHIYVYPLSMFCIHLYIEESPHNLIIFILLFTASFTTMQMVEYASISVRLYRIYAHCTQIQTHIRKMSNKQLRAPTTLAPAPSPHSTYFFYEPNGYEMKCREKESGEKTGNSNREPAICVPFEIF